MPVDVPGAVEPELRKLVRRPGDDAGEVHHLGQPEHAAAAHEGLEIARGQRTQR